MEPESFTMDHQEKMCWRTTPPWCLMFLHSLVFRSVFCSVQGCLHSKDSWKIQTMCPTDAKGCRFASNALRLRFTESRTSLLWHTPTVALWRWREPKQIGSLSAYSHHE
jgi:hypothetical protein